MKPASKGLKLITFALQTALLSACLLGTAYAADPATSVKDTTVKDGAAPVSDRSAPASPNNSAPAQPAKQSASDRRDDRVYINEIYPEYCRSYFTRRDWVSLFEYREGMYRCFHGVDSH